jgi:molybdopterin synthase sulfur carrier subunit
MMRLLFFGRLKDVAGAAQRSLEPPHGVRTAAELIDWIGRDEPTLGEALRSRSVRIAVDAEFVSRETSVAGAKEIAFMPPFSGG